MSFDKCVRHLNAKFRLHFNMFKGSVGNYDIL